MNVLVSSAIAGAVTISPVEMANPDAEIIAAGKKFGELLPKYMTAWFEWSRLQREASAETHARFGKNHGSPAWMEGKRPAQVFLHEALERNGTRQASEAVEALYDEMEPIAELIRDSDIESLAGLRSKALVAIWDSRPTCAVHKGVLNFEDEWSLHSLVTGVSSPLPGCVTSTALSWSKSRKTPPRGWTLRNPSEEEGFPGSPPVRAGGLVFDALLRKNRGR
jgi:hypothetical protein